MRQINDCNSGVADIHGDDIAKDDDLHRRDAEQNDQRSRVAENVQEFFADEGYELRH